jgi:hypothetical protein
LFLSAVSWSRKNRDFALWNYLDIFGEELLQLLQVIEEKTMKKLKEVRPQGASSRWQAQEKNNTPVVRSEDRNNSEPQKSATNLSQSPLEMRFEKFGSPSGIIHR